MAEKPTLELQQLPPDVAEILQRLDVDPYLLAHLVLVHDTAWGLTKAIAETWPDLIFDIDHVLFGAALHDIGKHLHPEEMGQPGTQHHEAGRNLLRTLGIEDERARFAFTHGAWRRGDPLTIEDLLVALADVAWAGGRNRDLEDLVSQGLNAVDGREMWQTFMDLDDILTALAKDAELRLVWQTQFAPESGGSEQSG